MATIFWFSIYGVHIGATWRIRLNRPCAAAMRPVQLYLPGGANMHPIYRKPKNGCHDNIHQKLNLGYVFMGIASPQKLTAKIKQRIAGYHTTKVIVH